ncbi:MAG TPA: glycosyltransferase [Gemmatimonadales bacterium]|nr:glycosyltransferase [Gemmatimonadales bacterium]
MTGLASMTQDPDDMAERSADERQGALERRRRAPHRVTSSTRSIALLNPLGDYGIGGYTHELAEGLVAAGVTADVYSSSSPAVQALPRRHRLYPVLGSMLLKQKAKLARGAPVAPPPIAPRPAVLDRPQRVAESVAGSASPGSLVAAATTAARARLRPLVLASELLLHLRSRRYDLVWTQWPLLGGYDPWLRRFCRALGMPLVHTVHNVLPHDSPPEVAPLYRAVYEQYDALIVHSDYAARELAELAPAVAARTMVVPHGTYTYFPDRSAARADVRRQLELPEDRLVVLFFGGVRPYKNLDALLEALPHPALADTVVLVAGHESGYPDLVPGDTLGRTRARAAALGIADRLRLLSGPFDATTTAELFAAADVVALPYLKSYGSGLLLQAMTFGKHVLATRTGGMDEHLVDYPWHTMLEATDPDAVIAGLREARAAVRSNPPPARPALPKLAWPYLAEVTLAGIEARLGRGRA